jgi:hypothetical protein
MGGWLPWRRGTADAAPTPAIGRLITVPTTAGNREAESADSSPAAYADQTAPPNPSTHISFDDLNLPVIVPAADKSPARLAEPNVVALTDAQVEAIAERVAERLAAGLLGDRIRESLLRMVSDTSERLVREEIVRVRAEAERE